MDKLTDRIPTIPAKVELSPRELGVLLTLVNRAQITGAEADEVVEVKAKLSLLLQKLTAGNGI
tara:strand:- start:1298 stop:1486 length:189 start_codon:yes stop_codon:yes gene_type:complete